MKFAQFEKDLENRNLSAIYLFSGEEIFFHDKGLKLLKESLIQEPSLNYALFDGEEVDLQELITSASAYPFLSQYRLTCVKEFYPKSDGAKKLVSALSQSKNSILAIFNKKPCETLANKDGVTIVETQKLEAGYIAKYIVSRFNDSGKKIDYESAKLLAEYSLNNLARIELEIEKIISYSSNDQYITEDVIRLLVPRETDYKIYEMTNFITSRNFSSALDIVNELLSRGETPQRIIVNIYYHVRKLLFVKISDKSSIETAKMLGFKDDYPIKKILSQAKNLNVKALKNAMDTLADIDYKIKNGQLDQNQIMWNVIFKIMTEI